MLTSFSALQDGGTPLYMASQEGHVSIVDILLRNGADPNLAETVSMEVVCYRYPSCVLYMYSQFLSPF